MWYVKDKNTGAYQREGILYATYLCFRDCLKQDASFYYSMEAAERAFVICDETEEDFEVVFEQEEE
jgi:hypothetical protein